MSAARKVAPLADAQRRFIARLLMGEHPDAAMRVAGITPAQAGRAIAEPGAHLAAIAKACGATVIAAQRLLAGAAAQHAGRLAELLDAAALADAERQRLPDAPTAERLVKGAIVQGVAKAPDDPRGKAEVRVYVDTRPTPLRDAYEAGKLPRRSLEAGERIEAMVSLCAVTGGPRSCLDWSPRGTGESEPAYRARIADEVRALRKHLTPPVWDVVAGVVVFHQPTGERRQGQRRWRVLLAGLQAAADQFGLPVDV